MKKILLLTTCLLGTLVAADTSSLTDTNPTTTLAAATPVIDALVSFSPNPSTSTPSTSSSSHLEGPAALKPHVEDFSEWARKKLKNSIAFAQLGKKHSYLASRILKRALKERPLSSDDDDIEVDYLTSFDGSNSKKRKIGKEEADAAPLPKKPKMQEDYPFNLPKDLLSLTLEYLETSDLLAFDYPALRPFVKTLYMHGELVDRCACLQNFPNLTKLSLIDGREIDEEDILAGRYHPCHDDWYVWDLRNCTPAVRPVIS